MAAEFEEVIVSTNPGNAQQVLPDSRNLRFDFALWGFVFAVDQCITVRCRQGLAVEFAVRGQRHGLKSYINGRHHVLRQLFLQMPAQAVDVDHGLPGRHGVISHQTLVARHIFASGHYGFVDGRMFGQTRIDLAELDTEATDLDLIVVTAEVFDIAIRQIAAKVAGAVHARRWVLAERVFEEALGGQIVAVQVTTGHAGTADVDLTGYTHWHRLLLLVQQVKLRIADRLADVRCEAVFAIHGHPA